MRVSVIGAGIFGCTAAVELARAGHEVDLFERHMDLLHGASRASCARLHHGYHYPRSPQTDMADHAARFAARFPDAIDRSARHYYGIARDGSQTSGAEFLAFCDRRGLPYEEVTPLQVIPDAVDVCVRVPEALVDIPALRAGLRRELGYAGVGLGVGGALTRNPGGYDWTVWATYGLGGSRVLQWEVCETALVRLGRQFAHHSFVVLDGPFACLDPVPGRDCHVLYSVVNSVHSRNIGEAPEIPDHLAPLLDRGPIFTPHTQVDAMLDDARRFLAVGTPEYFGSLFTVRAVLPGVDGSDERPTLVEVDGNTVSILAGKIDAAVWAAEQVVSLVREAVPA